MNRSNKKNPNNLAPLPQGQKLPEFSATITPCKKLFEALTNSFLKSRSSNKSLSTIEKTLTKQMNKDPSKYCSLSFNELLDSDMKYKSPSKLCNMRMNFSPWKAPEELGIGIGQRNSPNIASGYKINLKPDHETFFGTFNENLPLSSLHSRLISALEHPVSSQKKLSESQMSDCVVIETRETRKERLNSSMRKRKRKSNQQLKILKNEFEKCQEWSKDQITTVAQKTGLSESQVYKWCWDQKRKREGDLDGEKSERDYDSTNNNFQFDYTSKYKLREGLEVSEFGKSNTSNGLLKKRKPFGLVNDLRIESDRKRLKNY